MAWERERGGNLGEGGRGKGELWNRAVLETKRATENKIRR